MAAATMFDESVVVLTSGEYNAVIIKSNEVEATVDVSHDSLIHVIIGPNNDQSRRRTYTYKAISRNWLSCLLGHVKASLRKYNTICTTICM
jgi:hypothetical protein